MGLGEKMISCGKTSKIRVGPTDRNRISLIVANHEKGPHNLPANFGGPSGPSRTANPSYFRSNGSKIISDPGVTEGSEWRCLLGELSNIATLIDFTTSGLDARKAIAQKIPNKPYS